MTKKTKLDERQGNLGLGYQQLDEWPEDYYDLCDIFVHKLSLDEVGLDIETNNSLNPYTDHSFIKCISISTPEKSFCLTRRDFRLGIGIIKDIIESPNYMIIGHNIKFDLNHMIMNFGWEVNCLTYDTMLAAYFLNENEKFISLEKLIDRYKVMPQFKTSLRHISEKDLLLRNMKDARACAILKRDVFDPLLSKFGLIKIMNVACQAVPMLSRVETRGIMVNMTYARQQQLKLYDKLIQHRLSLRELAQKPFNPDSPDQLRRVLFGNFGFNHVFLTETGAASTNYESLLRIRQEQCNERPQNQVKFMDILLDYVKLETLNENYYNKLPKWIQTDGAIHPNYNIGASTTGRLTCNAPNMQSQKRGTEFRGVYQPRDGYIFIEGDWSTIEMRILAELAGETNMIEIFKGGKDFHTAVMCEMKGWDYKTYNDIYNNPSHPDYQDVKNLRVGIKNVNFGEAYGASADRLQRELMKNGIYWDLDECVALYDNRKSMYPNIVRWKKDVEKFAIRNKYVVMPFGQIRRCPEASYKTAQGHRELRQVVNFIIQSTASAWIPIIGMIILDNYFKEHREWDGHILLQVHDSVLSEVLIRDSVYMEQLRKDIQQIMEEDIKQFIYEFFKFDIKVPLEFKCEYMEKWR